MVYHHVEKYLKGVSGISVLQKDTRRVNGDAYPLGRRREGDDEEGQTLSLGAWVKYREELPCF